MAPKPWSPSDSGKHILLLILPNSLPGEPQIPRARHGTDRGQQRRFELGEKGLKSISELASHSVCGVRASIHPHPKALSKSQKRVKIQIVNILLINDVD